MRNPCYIDAAVPEDLRGLLDLLARYAVVDRLPIQIDQMNLAIGSHKLREFKIVAVAGTQHAKSIPRRGAVLQQQLSDLAAMGRIQLPAVATELISPAMLGSQTVHLGNSRSPTTADS
jgi:hypothetical protein